MESVYSLLELTASFIPFQIYAIPAIPLKANFASNSAIIIVNPTLKNDSLIILSFNYSFNVFISIFYILF